MRTSCTSDGRRSAWQAEQAVPSIGTTALGLRDTHSFLKRAIAASPSSALDDAQFRSTSGELRLGRPAALVPRGLGLLAQRLLLVALLAESGDRGIGGLELLPDLEKPVLLGLELALHVVQLGNHRGELLHVGDLALLLAEVLALLAQRLDLGLQRRLLRGQRLAAHACVLQLVVTLGELRAQRRERLRGRVPLPPERGAAVQQALQRDVPGQLFPRPSTHLPLASTPNPAWPTSAGREPLPFVVGPPGFEPGTNRL